MRIADLIEREGRALVIAVNRWDLMGKQASLVAGLRTDAITCCRRSRACRSWGVRPVGRGHRPSDEFDQQAYAVSNKRLPTATLNRWFEQAVDNNPPPACRAGG